MTKTRLIPLPVLFVLVAAAFTAGFVPAARAGGDVDQKAVDRAHDFLKMEKCGRDILGYVHFGAKYKDHNYKEIRTVKDAEGKLRKGYFALIYTFEWEDDGETNVAFLCDPAGKIYRVQIVDTNAVLQQPFLTANVAIKVLGNLLAEAFKEKMTKAERKDLQKLIDDADAKAMLEWSLAFQQALGK